MNLIYGELVSLFEENGVRMGRVRVGGAFTRVPVELIDSARPGDTVLMCNGVAISKVEEEPSHVPGHSR